VTLTERLPTLMPWPRLTVTCAPATLRVALLSVALTSSICTPRMLMLALGVLRSKVIVHCVVLQLEVAPLPLQPTRAPTASVAASMTAARNLPGCRATMNQILGRSSGGKLMIDRVVAVLRDVADEVVLPRFRNLTNEEVEEKAPGDLVTVADREAEVALAGRRGGRRGRSPGAVQNR
jgi:hypothetical protein